MCGRPPFDGTDDREIVKSVKIGSYQLSGPIWKNVSKEGIDLIKKMLTYDSSSRISADEALQHSWIKKKVHDNVDPKTT